MNTPSDKDANVVDWKQSFLLAEFEALRIEIISAMRTQNDLLFRFLLMAFFFYFFVFIGRVPPPVSSVVSDQESSILIPSAFKLFVAIGIPLAAFITFIWYSNIAKHIEIIGSYIRDKVEPEFYSSKEAGWEQFLDNYYTYRPVSPLKNADPWIWSTIFVGCAFATYAIIMDLFESCRSINFLICVYQQ